jgi:hypothetical protein
MTADRDDDDDSRVDGESAAAEASVDDAANVDEPANTDDAGDDAPRGPSVRAISGGALAIRTPAEFETILGTADEITFDLPEAFDLHHLVRGTTIAGHVVLAHHAEDVLGPTYVAYDGTRDRKVLLRLIPIALESAFAGHQSALVDSLATIAQISHPCVVAIHDVGLWTGGVYVATEFIDGIALRTWIEARDDPFPWREVLRIFREVGRGIVAAHAAGVQHRDLSPDHILIGEGGQVKVADFGLAASADAGDDQTTAALTPLRERLGLSDDAVTSAMVGAIEYAAPEVLAGAAADRKSDQFSFCVALYETLWGERPFVATDRAALAAEYVRGEPRPEPSDARVPPWLRAIVLRGLSIRPADRWPSMERLVRELDRDPAASLRRWRRALAVVAVFAAGAGAIAWQAERADAACTHGAEAFNGVWDQARRAELEQTFLASNASYAPQNFAATADVIDTWASTWLEHQVAACEASRTRGDLSEELYAERRACLEERQDELRSLLAVFEAADPQQLDRAALAAESLTPSRTCSRGRAGSRFARVGADVTAVEEPDPQVAELRARIDRAWVLLRLESPASAGASIADITLETLRDPALRVSVLRLRGGVERALDRPTESETLLRDAAVLASRAGLDHALVLSWTDLAEVLADQPERECEATHLLDQTRAVMDRSRFDHARWHADIVRAEVAAAAGKPGDALLHYHAAMADLDRLGTAPWARTDLLVRIGTLIAEQGDITAGLGYLQRAHDGVRDRLGPRHPALAEILLATGDLQARQHSRIEARTSWEDALSIYAEAHGPTARTTTITTLAIAKRLRDEADGAGALEYDRRALAAIDGGGDSDPTLRAAALLDQGRTLLALARDGDAQAPLRQAFELHDAVWRAAAKEPSATARREIAARWLEAAVLLVRAMASDPASRGRAIEQGRAARAVATENGLALDPWLVELLRSDANGAAP